MTTLIMLSGGLDSTYVLARFLKETDEELVVHRVNLLDNAGRHEVESVACQRVVEYCKENFRDFFYSETTIDHRRLLAQGFDVLAIALEAGAVAASYHLATEKRIDEWVIGRCTEETLPPSRQKLAQQICEMNCQGVVEPPDWCWRIPRISQQEEVNYLPYDLYRLTWSCRKPVMVDGGAKKCGTCHSCTRLQGVSHPDASETVTTT